MKEHVRIISDGSDLGTSVEVVDADGNATRIPKVKSVTWSITASGGRRGGRRVALATIVVVKPVVDLRADKVRRQEEEFPPVELPEVVVPINEPRRWWQRLLGGGR